MIFLRWNVFGLLSTRMVPRIVFTLAHSESRTKRDDRRPTKCTFDMNGAVVMYAIFNTYCWFV